MIKTILFDMDNTLIDFMKMKKMCIDAATDAMINAGIKMGKEDIKKKLFELYKEHGIEYEYIFQEFLKKTTGKVDYKILASAIVAYRKVRVGLLEHYPGVEKTLIKLKEKGLKLGIVTDAPKLKAWIRLVSMGIEDFFDAVVCSGKNKKPHSLPFKKALTQLKAKPSETLMVGDSPTRDIQGAKELGMKTCFARYGYAGEQEIGKIADYELERFEDLLKLV